jgi:hypothetical protein
MFYHIQAGCSSGPSSSERSLCNMKALRLQEKLKSSWVLDGDATEWLENELAVDFFPWEPRPGSIVHSTKPIGTGCSKPGKMNTTAINEILRVDPIKLLAPGGRLIVAKRAEGGVSYHYDGKRLSLEAVESGKIPGNYIHGYYKYDGHGRFDGIQYTDGMHIKARYGDGGELLSLESTDGRKVGFCYRQVGEGPFAVVAPLTHVFQFHSAVSLFRLKERPAWWRPSRRGEPTGQMPVIPIESVRAPLDDAARHVQRKTEMITGGMNGIYIMLMAATRR